MSPAHLLIALAALLAFAPAAAAPEKFPRCSNRYARYKITFINRLTPKRFGNKIPKTGLVYSPLTAISHNHRLSFLSVRGYASEAVEDIAETGDNSKLFAMANMKRKNMMGVMSAVKAGGPTLPGKTTRLMVRVNCKHSQVTVIGMIAPSPDWIVQISNVQLWNWHTRRWKRWMSGPLMAYDAGTDSGGMFTNPADPSLDKPTMPAKNIAPLYEDMTNPFGMRPVGYYTIRRM